MANVWPEPSRNILSGRCSISAPASTQARSRFDLSPLYGLVPLAFVYSF
jgi:hypothetical protein